MIRALGSPSRRLLCLVLLACVGCGGRSSSAPPPERPARAGAEARVDATRASPSPPPIVLSLVGTNDVHGRLASLPILGGYLANLRAARGDDGVVLVDAGDIFQGTLESNVAEGAPMVAGYDALHYDAITLGNHEFDYGPVGPESTPRASADDPRGALKARARQASFPFLSANIVEAATSRPVDWPNFHPTALLHKKGITVGLIGIATQDTARTTITTNFAGLTVLPAAPVVLARAAELRKEGAGLVIVIAHAGGKCLSFGEDARSCEEDQEIMKLALALPPGTVDAIVAGHTHEGMANRVHGTPIIESFSYGKDFGRIDFTFDGATHALTRTEIQRPQPLTLPATYLDRPVSADATLAALIAPAMEAARGRKEELLGFALGTRIARDHAHESALGNLFADLMLRARPGAQVAMMNGGGLRADFPPGPFRYGALFEAMPFDNRLAVVHVTGAELRRVVKDNLVTGHGIASWAGLQVVASCRSGALDIKLEKPGGGVIGDRDPLTLVTSDFVALGGDGVAFAEGSIRIEDQLVRDALEKGLRSFAGRPPLTAAMLYDPGHRRVLYPGERPVRCDTR